MNPKSELGSILIVRMSLNHEMSQTRKQNSTKERCFFKAVWAFPSVKRFIPWNRKEPKHLADESSRLCQGVLKRDQQVTLAQIEVRSGRDLERMGHLHNKDGRVDLA